MCLSPCQEVGVLTLLILKLIRNSILKLKTITHTKTDVLKSPSHEVGGIDITHTPPKLMCSSLQVKSWGMVLTLPIPPKLMSSSLPSQKVGDIDITHIPKLNWWAHVTKSRGGGGGIDITHTPHKTDVLVSMSRGGGIDITYTPPKLMCSSLQVMRWGVLTLHMPLPHQTDVLNYPSWWGSILMCMGKEGVVLITMHWNKSGVRFLSYLF